jgi:hypothetical protein
MISIGFRASPDAVHYAVLAQEADAVVVRNVSLVVVPAALHAPEQLRFIRITLLDVIADYRADRAGIRTTEPISKGVSVARLNIEGVIQELLASGATPTYFAGPIAKIAGLLKLKPALVKQYMQGTETYPGSGQWSKYSTEGREAVLAARAALAVPAPRFVSLAEEDAAGPSAPGGHH